MKKRLLLLSVLTLFLHATSWAADFTVDGISYNITNSDDNTVEVTSGGSYTGTVTIPETVTNEGTTYTVTSIGEWAFYRCLSLTSVNMPNGVTSIEDCTFWGCSSLTSIKIPDNVTSIGDWAFAYCTNLEEMNISDGVTSIGNYTFYDCSALTSVTIGKSVTSIGTQAFYGCSALAKVTSLNTSPPSCQSNTFTNVPTSTCILYVPVGSREDYSTPTGWKDFGSIVELNGDGTIYYDPTVETSEVTDITYSSATVGGTFTKGTSDIEEYGFEYWVSGSETVKAECEDSEMTATLSGLADGTTYSYRAYATTEVRTVYGDTETFTIPTRPDVTTTAATSITDVSAMLNGTVTGGSEDVEITEKGFEYWSTENESDKKTAKVTEDEDEGNMSATIDELAEDTQYTYHAYATTEYGTTYGETVTFTTVKLPEVETTDATIETYNSVTLSGTVTQGSEDIEEQGFIYWTTDGDKSDEKTVTGVTEDENVVSATIEGLDEGKEYSYCTYVTTATKTVCGETKTFTTPTRPTVTTTDATDVTYESATLNGSVTGGSETTEKEYGFEYWSAEDESDKKTVEGTEDGGEGNISATISGLGEDVTYTYRAYATTEYGTTYGETRSFTTLNATLLKSIVREIEEVQTELTTAWEAIQTDYADVSVNYEGTYKDLADELEELLTTTEEAYSAGTLTTSTETLVRSSLTTISASITTLSAEAKTAESQYLYGIISGKIEEVESELTTAWEAIETDCADVAESFKTDHEAIATDLTELSTAMQIAKEEETLTQETVTAVEEALATISASIKELSTEAKEAEENYQLYTATVAEIVAVQNSLEEAWTTIQAGYADVASTFEETYKDISAQLATLLASTETTYEAGTLNDEAVKKVEDELATISASIEDLLANAKEAEKQYKLNDDLTEEVENAGGKLGDAWEDILSDYPDVADDFKEEYGALKEELDSLLVELEEAYGNGILTEELAEDIRRKIEEIMDAMDSLVSEAKEAEDEYLYNQLYEDAVSEVEATENSLEDAWTTIKTKYPDMVEDLQGIHDGIAAEIEAVRTALDEIYETGELTEDAVAEMEESLATIEKEIEDMLSNASITTGIDSMVADEDVRVYNLAGSRVHRLERGNVYIFHYLDGTSRKVLVK